MRGKRVADQTEGILTRFCIAQNCGIVGLDAIYEQTEGSHTSSLIAYGAYINLI